MKIDLTKLFKFEEGKFYWDGIGGFTMPSDPLAIFVALATENYGEDSNKIMYRTGEFYAKELNKKIKMLQPEIVLKALNSIGLGTFEMSIFNTSKETFTLKLFNNPLVESYRKLNGIQKDPVDYFMAGFLAKFFSNITGKNLSCTETQCFAQGKPYCVFNIKQ